MKLSKWILVLLLPPALFSLLLLVAVFVLVVQFAPPMVSLAALVFVVVFVLWLVFRFRGSGSHGVTESSLLHQTSKDGLL